MAYENTQMISFIGAFAGALSVSIAVYLQLMTNRKCHPKYVLGYFAAGTILIMMNLEPFVRSGDVAMLFEALAYCIIVLGEVYMGMKIYSESEQEEISVEIPLNEITRRISRFKD